MPNVTLGAFNTVAITAASGVYRLAGRAGSVDVMNLGPGAVYVRTDQDPTVADPNSLQIPANWAVNKLPADANNGLRVIAAADTTISVRTS